METVATRSSAPLPSIAPPPPTPSPSLSHAPTLTHAQSLTLPLPLALSRILSISGSHADIPVPLTPFRNWAKTKQASVIPLHQHKPDNNFLCRCNHVAILIQTTKIVCNLSQTRGKKGLLRFLCFTQFTKGVKTTIDSCTHCIMEFPGKDDSVMVSNLLRHLVYLARVSSATPIPHGLDYFSWHSTRHGPSSPVPLKTGWYNLPGPSSGQ